MSWSRKDPRRAHRAACGCRCSGDVMDDGFFRTRAAQDLSIVVVDAARDLATSGATGGPFAVKRRTVWRVRISYVHRSAQDQAHFDTTALPENCRMSVPELAPLQTGIVRHAGATFAGSATREILCHPCAISGRDCPTPKRLEDHQPLNPALMGPPLRPTLPCGAQLSQRKKDAVRLPASFQK